MSRTWWSSGCVCRWSHVICVSRCCKFESCSEHFLIYICSMTLSGTWRNGKTQVYFQPRLANQNLTNILHTAGYNFKCYKVKFTNVWVQFPCQNLTSLTPLVWLASDQTVCGCSPPTGPWQQVTYCSLSLISLIGANIVTHLIYHIL